VPVLFVLNNIVVSYVYDPLLFVVSYVIISVVSWSITISGLT
jgi:hypothetical protein